MKTRATVAWEVGQPLHIEEVDLEGPKAGEALLCKSLASGMTFQQFLSTAMAGRQAKGMPSWAGFFEEKDIRAIYDYIKARQLELVPVGRSPSAQDRFQGTPCRRCCAQPV